MLQVVVVAIVVVEDGEAQRPTRATRRKEGAGTSQRHVSRGVALLRLSSKVSHLNVLWTDVLRVAVGTSSSSMPYSTGRGWRLKLNARGILDSGSIRGPFLHGCTLSRLTS